MKKLIIIIAFLSQCIYTYAQEKRTDKLITFTLPAGAEKPSLQKLSSSFKVRKNTLASDPALYKGSTYQFDKLLLQINADTATMSNDHVEKFKSSQDHFAKKSTAKYSSEFRVVNGNKVALMQRETVKIGRYYFMATNKENNKQAFAILEYYKEDESKAKIFINQVINTLKFK